MSTRRSLFMLCYLMAAAVAILLALEAGVRLLKIAPPLNVEMGSDYAPDPFIPYKRKPFSRQRGRSVTDEFDYDNAHNSLGFRDIEHTFDKPPGVFRIVCIGDSFTYGVGAPFDETYPRRLERMLNARGGPHPRVEIINLGMGRFFPEPERMTLESYGLKFHPDLVIVGFLPNDVLDTFYGLDSVKLDGSGALVSSRAAALGSWGKTCYTRSHLCRILLGKYVASTQPKFPWKSWDDMIEHAEPEWQKIEIEYGKIAGLVAAGHARLLVLHIPQAPPWRTYSAQRLGAWCAARGIEFADATPALEQISASGERLYYEKNGHCTPAGYRVISEVLFDYLTKKNPVA